MNTSSQEIPLDSRNSSVGQKNHSARTLSRNFLDQLTLGRGNDVDFDQILPPEWQAKSSVHWTPVLAAHHMADWLRDRPKCRFIDVGSGVGKVCLLMAILTDLEVTGIEQRGAILRIARQICLANAPGRVELLHGNFLGINWARYDVFYLYNPFFEQTLGNFSTGTIDRSILLSRSKFSSYVADAFKNFAKLEPGKRVITYHGYGGKMPPTFELIKSVHIKNGTLQMWEQTGSRPEALK